MCSSLLQKSIKGGLVVTGGLNLGGSIETIFNPTIWAQSSVNGGNGNSLLGNVSFFMTYGELSKVNISSISGNVSLGLSSPNNITNKTSTNKNLYKNTD